MRRAVTTALRLRSVDVLTAQEDGAATLDDDRLLQRATELGRILVPINFTRGTRFKHDPAVPIPPLPMLSAANDIRATPKELRGFAETQLTRGQNQVVAAMRAAIKTIARAT